MHNRILVCSSCSVNKQVDEKFEDLYENVVIMQVLSFQRCIIIGLYYLSLKQVNSVKCITAVRGSLTPITWISSYFCLQRFTSIFEPTIGVL